MTTPNDEPDYGMSCTIHSDCVKGIVRPEFTNEGAECVKAYDEYAARHGYSPTCPPGDLTPYRDWIKRADDPEIRPGDIAVWSAGDGTECGHTEVVTPRQGRHYRRQTRRQQVRSFLARLADIVRGRK